MAELEAGWHNDPYGRFQQRYFDGNAWTEHVATGGKQQVDPLGSSSVIPIAIPASAFATGKSAAVVKFLDASGPDSRERARPTMNVALAGLGGIVAAAAIFNAIAGDDGSKNKVTISALVSLAIGLVVRLAVKSQPEARSAAIGLGAVGLFGFVVGVTDDVAKTGPLFLIAALFLAAWALPGFRGRPLMLGIGALFTVLAVAAAFSPGSECRDEGFGDICETGNESFLGMPASFRGLFDTQRFVYLFAGALLLVLVWWLDKRGLRGIATPLTITALLSSFLGTLKSLADSGDVGPALIVLAVGVVVCAVGGHGGRRATTWLGAYQVTTGTGAFFAALIEPDSRGALTTTLMLTAVFLIAGPALVRAIRTRSTTTPEPPPLSESAT